MVFFFNVLLCFILVQGTPKSFSSVGADGMGASVVTAKAGPRESTVCL